MTVRARGGRKAPRRSGPSLTDERRAELGYGRLTLRLPRAALDILAARSRVTGLSRAQVIENLLRLADELVLSHAQR